MRIRAATVLLLGLLPASPLKNYCLKLAGWEVERGARIRSNIFINVRNVKLRKHAEIRAFNVFRNISLEVGENSIIGSFNWIGAASGLSSLSNFRGLLSLGCHSAINSRNYFDVSGGVYFGDFTDLAGVRSTIITHQIDMKSSTQSCNSVNIGSHTMICSNSVLVPGGTKIGDRCLFAMGSLIRSGEYPSDGFYAGAPAEYKKPSSGSWFVRKVGRTTT